MPLVNACCTNCGAKLEIDNTKEAAVCPHCGSAFIVEKAINNYNSNNYNNIRIENATIIQNAPMSNRKTNEDKKKELIDQLHFHLNHNDYNNAYKFACRLSKEDPCNVEYYHIQFRCLIERYKIDDSYNGDCKDALGRIKTIEKYETEYAKYNVDTSESNDLKEKLFYKMISNIDSTYENKKLSQLNHLLSVIDEGLEHTDDIVIKDKVTRSHYLIINDLK